MSKAPANGPRCAHHANLPAAVQCSECGDYLCRLCVRIERNIDTCVTCHSPCQNISGDAASGDDTDSYYAAVEFTQAPKPKVVRARVPEKKVLAESPLPPDAVPETSVQNSPPVPKWDVAAPTPRPLLGARLPPFFCKNHPEVKATRACRLCNLEYCNDCAKRVEGNPRCPECGGQINKLLPEDQGLPRHSVLHYLSDALAFPFRGSGIIMMIFGSMLVFFCSRGGWQALILSYALMYTFGVKICSSSATGRETPPDWPGAGDIGNAISYFVAWLVSQLPAIAYLLLLSGVSVTAFLSGAPDDVPIMQQAQSLMGDGASPLPSNQTESVQDQKLREERMRQQLEAQERKSAAALERMQRRLIPFYVLSFLGNLYLPMAVLALILYRNYSVLNPLFVVTSALRAGSGYLGTVLVFIAADFFRTLPGFLGEALKDTGTGLFVIPLFSSILFLYLLMVSMRSLGVMYYFNQRRLNWFT
jgi:hypothetical protein